LTLEDGAVGGRTAQMFEAFSWTTSAMSCHAPLGHADAVLQENAGNEAMNRWHDMQALPAFAHVRF
jgi:hypothetical protein